METKLPEGDGVGQLSSELVAFAAIDETDDLPLPCPVADEARRVEVLQRHSPGASDVPRPQQRFADGHERTGELMQRVGLGNFLEGIEVEPVPEMIAHPRENPYVFYEDYYEEGDEDDEDEDDE